MTTIAAVSIMLAVEVAAMLWAAWQPNPYRLRGICVVLNMLAISLFGPALMTVAGWTTNVGNVWYATAICAQCIILERHGRDEARATIPMVYGAITMMLGVCVALHQFPVLPATEMGRAIHILTGHQPRLVMGSYVAFFLAQMALIAAWGWLRPRCSAGWTVLLATLACQLVDTPVFFVSAFAGEIPWPVLVEIMGVGLAAKIGLAVVLLPVFAVAVREPLVRAALMKE